MAKRVPHTEKSVAIDRVKRLLGVKTDMAIRALVAADSSFPRPDVDGRWFETQVKAWLQAEQHAH